MILLTTYFKKSILIAKISIHSLLITIKKTLKIADVFLSHTELINSFYSMHI